MGASPAFDLPAPPVDQHQIRYLAQSQPAGEAPADDFGHAAVVIATGRLAHGEVAVGGVVGDAAQEDDITLLAVKRSPPPPSGEN